MNRLANAYLIGLLAIVLVSACGSPEPVAETQAALNGYSVPPPGGWGSEPWTCAGPVGGYPAWVPTNFSVMNPINSWCQWQPSPYGIMPYHVSTCTWAPAPIWNGTAYLYSEPNFQGDCAMIWADTSGYTYDSDLVEANGWHSTWVPSGIPPQFAGIKSVKLAPWTNINFCAGPMTGPQDSNPCNLYHGIGAGTQASGVGWQGMIDPNGGLFFETNSIRIWAAK